MRKIKFRAWSKKMKKMYSWEEILHLLNIEELIKQENDEFELLLFTGLEDKNGKEIHEGDVVEWKFENEKGKYIDKMVVKNELTYIYPFDAVSTTNCEIIGNIYENPEFLKRGDTP